MLNQYVTGDQVPDVRSGRAIRRWRFAPTLSYQSCNLIQPKSVEHKRTRYSPTIAGLCIALGSSFGSAQPLSSESEQWFALDPKERIAYLQGFCRGLAAHNHLPGYNRLGDLTCERPMSQSKIRIRFCGKAFTPGAKLAIQHLDAFYKNKEYSHVPLWAAVAHHDDKACGEQTLKGGIAPIQARARCLYQLANMVLAGVSTAVLEKQKEECEKFN